MPSFHAKIHCPDIGGGPVEYDIEDVRDEHEAEFIARHRLKRQWGKGEDCQVELFPLDGWNEGKFDK